MNHYNSLVQTDEISETKSQVIMKVNFLGTAGVLRLVTFYV